MHTVQPFSTWIGVIWRCLFKREIIRQHDIRFRDLTHEDTLFIYEYLRHCSSCARIDFQGYIFKNTLNSLGSSHAYNVTYRWLLLAAEAGNDCFRRFKISPGDNWYANMHRLYAAHCASFLTTGYHKDSSLPYRVRISNWRKMLHNPFWMECGQFGFITRFQKAIWHIGKFRLFYILDPLLLLATRLHDR